MNQDSIDLKEKEIPMKSISELRGYTFVIPSQQRGYKWTKGNIDELISDLSDFIESRKPMYCLQPLAVVKLDERRYEVLDGQQRLTTIYLLHKYLFGKSPYAFEYARDSKDKHDAVDANRTEFLQNIDTKTPEEADQCIDYYFIWQAYNEIMEQLENAKVNKDGNEKTASADQFRDLLNATAESAQSVKVIWYEVALSKRHEIFRNLNSGKMELSNTELIKALFLNRESGLKGSYLSEAAVLFEQMEQELREDRFWYMFNTEEIRVGQNRMDVIFNIVAGCRKVDYDIDPRWSFRNYFDHGKGGCELEEKWTKVRHTYLRIRDLYEDIYTYHYIGFLKYCRNTDNTIAELLSIMRTNSKSELRKELRLMISAILKKNHDTLASYNYDSGAPALRRLFIIYNIETILSRYELLKDAKKLQFSYERFPFELLYMQSWDIEHIASKTDSDLTREQDREDWLISIKSDLGEKYSEADCQLQEDEYRAKKKGSFKTLYKKIMQFCEKQQGEDVIPDSVTQEELETGKRKDKNQLGNLTLLDSHTNRSFHNSLFPRKRRIVLAADGLRTDDEEKENRTQIVYIPVATRQCFTKSYRRGSDVNLNFWSQKDADEYFSDIEKKLRQYFTNQSNSEA